MSTRIGRILTLTIAFSVVPAFAFAQSTVGGATSGPNGATGSSPSFEPGGIGPGGTAWSGSMPRHNVNMGRGGGPRTGNGLGLTMQPGSPGNVTPSPTQSPPGTTGSGTIGGTAQ